ncbi:hypothetical protein FQR65_LT19244 [Abscondita terminalis]|nr:hypothetical protein FQR65_LT19244 [Abscondita terminalis]
MTLRQLAVFVAVAQEGTVTKASDAVRLTQSAASMALADLEDGLGAPLFDRLGKRLQLNDLGRFLLPQALEILGRCEAFEQAAKGELQSIDLRIGATLTISDYLMPDLMADFLQIQPQAHLQLQLSTRSSSRHIWDMQMYIIGRDDELAVCCSPSHPLANLHRELRQSDFQHVEWILREEGSGTREVFDNAILKDLQDANIRLTLGHNEAILKIVAGGLGMSCISKLAIQPLLDKGQLVILNTPFWQLARPLFMLVHRQKYQGPGLRAFMKFCESK